MENRAISVNSIDIEYFYGSAISLAKRVKFIAGFDKFIFFEILVASVVAIYSLFANNLFENLYLDIIITLAICAIFVLTLWYAKKDKIFSNKPKIQCLKFFVENIDVTENNETYVEAYKPEDTEKEKVYRFNFGNSLRLTSDFFKVYYVNIRGCETYYYCKTYSKRRN